MKNILIFGSTGMLGKELVQRLNSVSDKSDIGKVVDVERNSVNIIDSMGTIDEVNIRNFIRNQVVSNGITHVVNCVAATDTRKIESNIEERARSYKLNALFPKCLAEVCAQLELRLLHFSTDYTLSEYSCGNGDYRTCPLTHYGMHKLAGELFVRDTSHNYQILRIGWLYGVNREKSFIHKFLANCARTVKTGNLPIEVVNNQVSTPTSCKFVADAVLALISYPLDGTFSTAPIGTATRADFAIEILGNVDRLGDWFRNVKVERIEPADVVPQYTALCEDKSTFTKPQECVTWQQDLREYFDLHEHEFREYIEKIVNSTSQRLKTVEIAP